MSITFTNKWQIATASNNLLEGQATGSFSCFVSTATISNNNICGKSGILPFKLYWPGGINPFQFQIIGTSHQFNVTYTMNLNWVYHLAWTWTSGAQVAYINAASVGTAAFTESMASGLGTFGIGFFNSGGVMTMQDVAIWNGYALTASDVLALRNKTSTGLTLGTPATAYWTLDGSLGTTPNPVNGDAGLKDSTNNGYNLITISPNSGTAVYTADLTYVPPIVIPAAYASKNGLVVFHFEQNPLLPGVTANTPAPPTSVPTNPTIYQNGSPITCVGPFWTQTSHQDPFVVYQPTVTLLSTDTLAFTAADSWVQTAVGAVDSSPPPGTSGTVSLTNYVGQLEPGVYGQSGFNQAAGSRTLFLGTNANWPTTNSAIYSAFQNLLKRSLGKWTNATASDFGGRPQTISGTAFNALVVTNATNGVDSQTLPFAQGTFTFIADESAPSTPMVVQLAVNGNAVNSGSTVSGTGGLFSITPFFTSPGTLVGGVAVGKVWQWNVVYSGSATSWTYNLTLCVTGPSGGTATWTLSNEWFSGPGDGSQNPTTTRANPYAVSSAFTNWYTSVTGKTPYYIRWLDSILPFDGESNGVVAADLPDPTWFSWCARSSTTLTFTVVTIRALNLSVGNSPNVYADDQYPGFTAAPGGSPAAYWAQPTSTTYMNSDQNPTGSGWSCGEMVTSSAHGIKSGQLIALSPGTPVSVTCSNGVHSNSVNIVTTQGAFSGPVFVTSPTSFAFQTFANFSSGGFGNVSVGATGLSISGSVGNLATGALPYEAAAYATGQFANTNLHVPLGVIMTEACCAAIAVKVLANFPAGRKVLFEYVNEHWQAGNRVNVLNTLANIAVQAGAFSLSNAVSDQWYVKRYNDIMTNAILPVFAAAGRQNELVWAYGSSWGIPIHTANMVNYASLPANQIRMDVILVAPYLQMTGNFGTSSDVTYVYACASVYAANTASVAHGTAYATYPWTMPQFNDLVRHHYKYNTAFLSNWATHNADLKNYNVPGFSPVLACYECSNEVPVSVGVSQTVATLRSQITHDVNYDPSTYDVELAFHQMIQDGGAIWANQYCTALPRGQTGQSNTIGGVSDNLQVTEWALYQGGQGQVPGTGDGTDGQKVNEFFRTDGKAHDGPDLGTATPANVSVRGKAWLDWVDTVGSSTVTVTVVGTWQVILTNP